MAAILAGCAVEPHSFPLAMDATSDTSTRTIRGDWNDVRVGVEHGIVAGQFTVLQSETATDATLPTQTFALLGIDDTPATLVVTWLDAPSDVRDSKELLAERPTLATLELRLRVGQPGLRRDAAREQRVLDAVALRIRQLAGVKTAPLDAPPRS